MEVKRLTLGMLNRPDQAVSVYRTFYPPGHRCPLHDHDFPELFVIEDGRGLQRNGDVAMPLAAGDIGFVAADCAHDLTAAEDRAMVLVNIAFSQELLDRIRAFVADGDWPWEPGAAPVWTMDETLQAFVGGWIDRLASDEAVELDLGAFLLELIRQLRVPASRHGEGAPAWLTDALSGLDEPRHLAGGVRHLARTTGRSAAYLSRVVRRAFGCSTIQMINRHRLRWLARQLRLTRRPIVDLAAACGLANLSHCYRLFAAEYGCSPHRYRVRAQGGVEAPT